MKRKGVLAIVSGLFIFMLLIPASVLAEPDGSTYIWTDELLTNPGFETGDKTGWTDGGGGSMDVGSICSLCDDGPHSGSYQAYWNTSDSGHYAYQDVDLSPWASYIDYGNAVINATGWLISNKYSEPPWNQFYMQVRFYAVSDIEISSATYDTGTKNVATWAKYGVENYTIPNGARKVQIRFNTWNLSGDAGSADDFSVQVGYTATPTIKFEGRGWCPHEQKVVGNATFPAEITVTPRVEPEVSDIRFVGTLNLSYPNGSVVSFDLDLSGVKTRSIFFLSQHKVNKATGNVEWEAAFLGTWLTLEPEGLYIDYGGTVSVMLGEGASETTRPYFVAFRIPNVEIPEPQLTTTSDYTENLDSLIKWAVKRFDKLLARLNRTNFQKS